MLQLASKLHIKFLARMHGKSNMSGSLLFDGVSAHYKLAPVFAGIILMLINIEQWEDCSQS